jgi:hypothetical protein
MTEITRALARAFASLAHPKMLRLAELRRAPVLAAR